MENDTLSVYRTLRRFMANRSLDEKIELDTTKFNKIPTDVLKSVLIISLLAITLISSLLPFALRRAAISHNASIRRRHIFAGIFSLLSCFGGGVFLATCLLDLFPDTRELIGDGLEKLNIKSDFPLSEFLVAIGFFMVLFIEQIVLYFREKRDGGEFENETGAEDRRRLIRNRDETIAPNRIEQRRHTEPAPRLGTIENAPITRHRHNSKRQVVPIVTTPTSTGPPGTLEPKIEEEGISIYESTTQQQLEGELSNGNSVDMPAVIVPTTSIEEGGGSMADEATEDINAIRNDIHFDPESHSTFRAVMLVVALSTHSTFEGLALGLQIDASMAIQIFGALCIHKCVIAFSLGMRLVQSRLTTLSIVGCCLLFCISAVIGGFIGLAITEAIKTSSASMINGCLQGIACGTFLYITAFEILPHELNEGGNRLPKLMMLILGFTVICIFVLLYPNS